MNNVEKYEEYGVSIKVVGDKNKGLFFRVYTPFGYATDLYIEYHEFKNNLEGIKNIIASELGGDWQGTSVHLYSGILAGEMLKSLQFKGETLRKVNSINNKLKETI